MKTAPLLRELLFPGPRRLVDLARLLDLPLEATANHVLSGTRGGFIAKCTRGIYGLTAKGRATVLAAHPRCEICGATPTVGVRVFESSDPLTTRVVCQQDLGQ
jgi:hypothetical protein